MRSNGFHTPPTEQCTSLRDRLHKLCRIQRRRSRAIPDRLVGPSRWNLRLASNLYWLLHSDVGVLGNASETDQKDGMICEGTIPVVQRTRNVED